jgi:hypothetical protein
VSTALRCWIAGVALLASGLVLATRSPVGDLAGWGPAALMVVLVNAWAIAVSERAGSPRGLRTPRFPLGRRLAMVEPGVGGAALVVMGLVALCTRSWEVTAWVALILAILGVGALRRAAWFLVPATAIVHGLLTMDEFHTLGDLLGELNGGLAGLAWAVGQALVVCGPLLRTDVAALGWFGRWVAVLASLPGYVGAAWLAGHVPAVAELPAPVLFLVVLLAGGVAQSMLLGALSWAVSVSDRPAATASPASPYRVGMALLPGFLPLLLVAALPLAPWPEGSFAAGVDAAPEVWAAALLVLLLVPAVPAAALVGAALDRVDGRRGTGFAGSVGLGGLLVWLAIGPQLLPRLLEPDGPIARLAVLCGLGGRAATVRAALAAGSGDGPPALVLMGLPAGETCRAMTGLVLAVALLAARRVRHARPGGRRLGWTGPALLLALSAGGAWVLAERMGPPGMALGPVAACVLMLAVDLVRGEARVVEPAPEEQPASLVPDQHDRRCAGSSSGVPGGRRADDIPAPETATRAGPEPDAPAPSPTVREAIT